MGADSGNLLVMGVERYILTSSSMVKKSGQIVKAGEEKYRGKVCGLRIWGGSEGGIRQISST